MKNPWIDLPTRPPFVLPCDAPYINAFNQSAPRSTVVGTLAVVHWEMPVTTMSELALRPIVVGFKVTVSP